MPREKSYTDEFADLLRGILTKDPTKRYDLNIIKQHKWMLLSDNAINLKVDLAR
jgi:serine/threonine protein kinase